MAQMSAPGTQVTLGDMAAAQQTTATPNPTTHDELIEAAKEHAGDVIDEHYPEIDLDVIEWAVSTEATKSAGGCKPLGTKRKTTGARIRLTWGAYEKFGWEKFAETIRHELIHAYQFLTTGESDHGMMFQIQADKLDCAGECQRFTEAKYLVYCPVDGCEYEVGRQKRSKTVTQPSEYVCKECGHPLESRANLDHPEH